MKFKLLSSADFKGEIRQHRGISCGAFPSSLRGSYHSIPVSDNTVQDTVVYSFLKDDVAYIECENEFVFRYFENLAGKENVI